MVNIIFSHIRIILKFAGLLFVLLPLQVGFVNAAEGITAVNNFKTSQNTIASWFDEGSLNIYPNQFVYVVSTRHAQSASLASYGDNVLVAWSELSVKGVPFLYAKQRINGSWEQLGKLLNINSSSPVFYPTAAVNGERKLISWIESDIKNKLQVYVKEWNGTKWIGLGGSVNLDRSKKAISTSLAIFKNQPVVAWVEEGDKYDRLNVKVFDGTQWQAIGGKLNGNTFPIDIVLKVNENNIYIVWSEVADNNIVQVRVAKGDGSQWNNIGGVLNSSAVNHTFSPSLTFDSGKPIVAISEITEANVIAVNVKQFNGENWINIGEQLNANVKMHATSPVIATYNNLLYTIFSEKNTYNHSYVYVKSFFNGKWNFVGKMLNIRETSIAVSPTISVGNDLIAIWSEPNINGVFQINVKRLINEAGR